MIKFNFASEKGFGQSDKFVSDWKNLPRDEPRQVGEKYYLRYITDIVSLKDKDTESVVKGGMDNGFRFLLNFYGRSPEENVEYGKKYFNALQRPHCFFSFDFRVSSPLEVFIKVPQNFVDSHSKYSAVPAEDSEVIVNTPDWRQFVSKIKFLEDKYWQAGDMLSENEYVAKIEDRVVKFNRESKFLKKFRRSLVSYINRNQFDGDQIEIGMNDENGDITHIRGDGEILQIGHSNISNLIQVHSSVVNQTLRRTSEIYSNFKNSDLLLTDKVKQSFEGLVISKKDSSPSNNSSPLKNAKVGGISIEDAIGTAEKICKSAKKLGNQEKRKRIAKSEVDYLEERALAKEDDILSDIDKRFSEESLFVGNEFLNIENIDDIAKSSSVPDLEEIYRDVLNKIGSKQLLELVLECIGGDVLGDIIDVIFECPTEIEPLSIPFPDKIPTPDILGILSTILRKILLAVVSKIISMLLKRIFEELRKCVQDDVKGVTPPARAPESSGEGIISGGKSGTSPSDKILEEDSQKVLDKTGFSDDTVENLLDDLTLSLSFSEICNLFRGEATDETYIIVESIIDAKYPKIQEKLDNRSKLADFFETFGETAVEKVDKFCQSQFGTGVDKVNEFLCPEEGIRDQIRRDILSNKDLGQDEIDQLIECERERDKEKTEFFNNLAESDTPLRDMVYGDEDPQEFIRKAGPTAKENKNLSSVTNQQFLSIIENTINAYLDSVVSIRTGGDNSTRKKIRSSMNQLGTLQQEGGAVEFKGNGKTVRFTELVNNYVITEDGNQIASVNTEGDPVILNMRENFVQGVRDSLILKNSSLSVSTKEALEEEIFDTVLKEVGEQIIRSISDSYSKSRFKSDIRKFEDESFLKTSAPNTKDIVEFSKEKFMNREEESRRPREEALRVSKEVAALMWARYKVTQFSALTTPFTNVSSENIESSLSKGEFVDSFLNEDRDIQNTLEKLDYSEGSKVYEDYMNFLDNKFEDKSKWDVLKELVLEGNQNNLPILDQIALPPISKKNAERIVKIAKVATANGGFILDRFVYKPDSDKKERFTVKNVIPSSTQDFQYGLRLSIVTPDLKASKIKSLISNSIITSEDAFIGNNILSKIPDPSKLPQIPSGLELSQVSMIPLATAKVPVDIGDADIPTAVPSFDNYLEELREKLSEKFLQTISGGILLSLLRIYTFEKAKDSPTANLLEGSNMLRQIHENMIKLESGDNLPQYNN